MPCNTASQSRPAAPVNPKVVRYLLAALLLSSLLRVCLGTVRGHESGNDGPAEVRAQH